MLKLSRRLRVLILALILTDCSRDRKITSDFCILYTPLDTNLSENVIDYWKLKQSSVESKQKKGLKLTSEEQFFSIIILQIGNNDEKYYEKRCDISNAN